MNRNTVPLRKNNRLNALACSAAFLLAASSVLPALAATTNQIVIPLAKPGGNQTITNTINNSTADWDGDGASDDRRARVIFRETARLSPASWPNQTANQSTNFYGGAEAIYLNTTSVSGFARYMFRDVTPGAISFTSQANSAGANALHAVVVWFIGDFRNFDPATQSAALSAGSSMTMNLGTDAGDVAEHRWVVKQGGKYYVSAVSYNTSGTKTSDPSTNTWALYDPTTDLNFNQNGTFSPMTFDNIEGVGYYFEKDSTANQITSRVGSFSVNAVVDALLTPNSAPVHTVPGAQTVSEDTSLSISGLSVNDADGNLWYTKLTAAHGKLTVSLTGGARLDSGANTSGGLALAGTQDQINAALATLSYIGNTNYAGSDTITVLSSDTHAQTATNTVAITVTPVNDPPVGTSRALAATQFTPYIFTVDDFGFTDPADNPSNNFAAVKIASLPALGVLSLNSTPVLSNQVVLVTDIASSALSYLASGAGTNYDSFTFQVQDDGGTANGGIDLDPNPKTLTFNVTGVPVNHEPQGSDRAVATTVSAPYTFAATDFGFTDTNDVPANNFLNVKITTLPTLGTLTLWGSPVNPGDLVPQTSILGLTFTPVTGQLGSPYTSFTFQVQDDGGTANGGIDLDQSPNTLTINVLSLNHPPINTVPGPQTVAENTTLALTNISVHDVDDNLLNTDLMVGQGTLNVSLAGGATLGGGAMGTSWLRLAGTEPQINAALATLSYLGTTNYSGADTLTVTSTDSVGATDLDTVAITITPVNNPPAITVVGAQTGYEDTALPLYSGVSVTDPESGLATTRLSVGQGKLTVALDGGATISAGANNSATLTLSGTEAQVNAALTLITYQPNTNFNGLDTLTVLASDTGGEKATNTIDLAITAVPDTFTWDSAASRTSTVQDGPGNWDNSAANWWDNVSGDFPWPVSTGDDTATFGGGTSGTAGLVTVGTVAVNTLNFAVPFAGNYTLTNGTITLGGTSPTINADADATISSTIGGTNGLLKSGAGLLALSGTNTYTGRTRVDGGVLRGDWGLSVPTNGNLNLHGGLLEVSQNMTAASGTGAGQVQLSAINSGFSAFGSSNVTVALSGTVNLPPGSAGATLRLNAASANQELTLQASLSSSVRSYIQVDSTNKAARLSKKLSTGGSNVVLGKKGPGNLVLLAGWDVSGSCHPTIYDGTLTVDNCALNAPSTEEIVIGRYDTAHGTNGGSFVVKPRATVTANALNLGYADGGIGTAYLAGGVTTVKRVFKGATTNGLGVLSFDGGTLKAMDATRAATFLTDLDNVYVKSGGAILDDGGFSGITVSNALLEAGESTGGGLTKQGSGSLILAGTNTYSGPTVVSNGTLVIEGALGTGSVTVSTGTTLAGNGLINGPVTLQPGATLSVGTGGAVGEVLTVSNTLSLAGTTVLRLAKPDGIPTNDILAGVTGGSYGGTLVVSNVDGTLAAGDIFTLVTASGPLSGNFSSVLVQPTSLGLNGSFNPATGQLTITSTPSVPPPAVLSGLTRSATGLQLVWQGGTNRSCVLYSSTNVALPCISWEPIATNVVGADGLSTNDLSINRSEPKRFYLLSIPVN